jgi:LmbE family N-acetylglucosaminyl deacetylase
MRMRLWRAMLGMALTAVVWPGASHHRAAAAGAASAPKPPALPRMSAPTKQDRVLVVAPHCDDETVGCGGYLAMAAQAGAAVRVVEVTCGEGFSSAAQRLYGEKEVTLEEYLGLAETRKSECLAAVRELGLKPEQVSFLGYPDRGLGDMWLRNWSAKQAYTSPYTGLSSRPFADAEKRKAAYCGRSVLDDLERVLEEFRPTVVLCPHPNDLHGDHWAVYCYTVGALYESGMLNRVALRVYLVHQGSWPGVEEAAKTGNGSRSTRPAGPRGSEQANT